MTKAMRLLFVIKGLVVRGGGAERVFVDVVNDLAARGHRVDVATFDFAGQELFYELRESIPRHMMGAGAPGVSTPRANLPRICGYVRRLARDLKPDVAVAFMHSTYVPVAVGLAGTGVPLIASEHTASAHFVTRPVQRTLARMAQRMAFAKTVVSSVVYAEHPVSWRSNLRVLPNPVDFSAFAPARQSPPENKRILCVGGLRPEKDQGTLIEAFDRIAAEFPGWTLRLVGDGVERPAIEARIASSRYAERIELPGVIRDVASEYRDAAVVAMPSRYEAMPMVAIEAMASGRPVIGFSDCAGAAALIVDGQNGLLVEPGGDRAGALASGLRLLMGDTELRSAVGSKAPATVEGYSLDAIATQWEDLLAEAAATRSNRSHATASSSGRTKRFEESP